MRRMQLTMKNQAMPSQSEDIKFTANCTRQHTDMRLCDGAPIWPVFSFLAVVIDFLTAARVNALARQRDVTYA